MRVAHTKTKNKPCGQSPHSNFAFEVVFLVLNLLLLLIFAFQGILTNMFEHVDAQRIVRVCEEAWPDEQRRESRRDGGLGSPFLWLLSFWRSKRK
ncbi:MAG: hypothetical protein B7Y56_00425 [Gallionellales bacterium 35-53-114]|nr:MAG: hypothetical protein B7Y56_00425 [Gallionellales bacterium 35-53-114]